MNRWRNSASRTVFVVANREFLIYGDEGIHLQVGTGFWNDVRDEMPEALPGGRCDAGELAGFGGAIGSW